MLQNSFWTALELVCVISSTTCNAIFLTMNAASQSYHKARAGNAAPSSAKADKVMLYKARAGNAALAMLKLSKPNVKFC